MKIYKKNCGEGGRNSVSKFEHHKYKMRTLSVGTVVPGSTGGLEISMDFSEL
jgi:hypothetical protein